MRDNKKGKILAIIVILVIIPLVILSVVMITNKTNNNITELEKEEIQTYIEMIYDEYYDETVPEFENINNAKEDWIWMMALSYLETIKYPDEYKGFASNEVKEAANILYGNNFNKEITKDSSKHVIYFEDENKYRSEAMSSDILNRFVVKDIIKEHNQYIVDVIEYNECSDYHEDTYCEVILDSKYEEMTSFNREHFYATNDEEMKLLEEESANVEAKFKDYVLENADKFNIKTLVLKRDEGTDLLYIVSSKNK